LLHGFAGNAPKGAAIVGDGANPNGGLILDKAGNVYGWNPDAGLAFDSMRRLYGTTLGSATNHGEVYRLGTVTASGEMTETPLYDFKDSPDGAHPDGPLVFDRAGNIYGITQGGGTGTDCIYGGCGTVYELSP
jgi:hypothetical protein